MNSQAKIQEASSAPPPNNPKLEKAKKELFWFFNEAEAAMGVKSNFDAFIQACKYSMSHQDEFDKTAFSEMLMSQTTQNSILVATGRERKILKAYSKLSSKQKIVLEAYYEERNFNSALAKSFGPGIGLIPFTKTGQTFSKVLLREPGEAFVREFKKNVIKVQKDVSALYEDAVIAFSNALESSK